MSKAVDEMIDTRCREAINTARHVAMFAGDVLGVRDAAAALTKDDPSIEDIDDLRLNLNLMRCALRGYSATHFACWFSTRYAVECVTEATLLYLLWHDQRTGQSCPASKWVKMSNMIDTVAEKAKRAHECVAEENEAAAK